MKAIFKMVVVLTVALASSLIYSCNSNTTRAKLKENQVSGSDTAVISFREYEHDLGRLAEGEKVSSIFTFENKGKGPLVILSVTTSCGCTVPKYDTKPINPGSTGSLEVLFDSSGKSGKQSKTITVRSNASKPIVLLKITCDVLTSTNN